MFGLIHRLTVHPGQRDRLVALMTEGGASGGCLSLVVAHEPGNPEGVWVTEVWESEDTWRASLELPWVKATIEQSRHLVASFDAPATTRPVVVRS